MSRTEEARLVLADADIIHLQRVLVTDTHEFIKYWRGHGKAVVADHDDAYDLILPTNAAAKFWLDGKVDIRLESGISYEKEMIPHPLQQFKDGLSICTAGITPSRILSQDWASYTPMFVVPNYLQSERYQIRKQDNSPNILLGWGGSLSHTQSFKDSGIQEALARILQEYRDVYLLIIGDQRVVDQLPVPRHKVLFQNYVPWWEWQHSLMRYDIGLAPLSGDYDDRRSNLKVAEYLMAGLPFVATRSPVYEEFYHADSGIFTEHGHNRHNYASRTESWYNAIVKMIKNIEEYRGRAAANIEQIGMTYDVDRNVPNIIDVYERIIELEK